MPIMPLHWTYGIKLYLQLNNGMKKALDVSFMDEWLSGTEENWESLCCLSTLKVHVLVKQGRNTLPHFGMPYGVFGDTNVICVSFYL